MTLGRSLLAGGLLVLSASFGVAAEPPDKKETSEVSYYKDVRRIFQQHCQGCHQPAKPQGGYVMTGYADLLKPGEHEQPGVVPGHPEQSMVVEQLLPKAGKKPAMPKGKDPLPAADVEIIKKWIAAGAKNDTPKTQEHVVDAAHPPVYTLSPDLSCVTYSPDGTLLAVSGYHEVLLHKADGSGLVGRLVGLSERSRVDRVFARRQRVGRRRRLAGTLRRDPGLGRGQARTETVRARHLRHRLRSQLVARRQ